MMIAPRPWLSLKRSALTRGRQALLSDGHVAFGASRHEVDRAALTMLTART